MEVLKKKMLVGLDKRADWEGKLQSVLQEVVSLLDLQLDEQEQNHLAALPGAIANLIYAGMLHSVVFEFAGEACEVQLEYYPHEEDEDDLDLSVLDVVDWDVNMLRVRILVDDVTYAEAITGSALTNLSSDRLTVELKQAEVDETASTDKADGEPRWGKVREDDEQANGKEEE